MISVVLDILFLYLRTTHVWMITLIYRKYKPTYIQQIDQKLSIGQGVKRTQVISASIMTQRSPERLDKIMKQSQILKFLLFRFPYAQLKD